MNEHPDRVAQIHYFRDIPSGVRFIEMSDELVEVFEAWAASHQTSLDWHEGSPYGVVVDFVEYRQLMARLRELLRVEVSPDDISSLAVLRAAVARLEVMTGQEGVRG